MLVIEQYRMNEKIILMGVFLEEGHCELAPCEINRKMYRIVVFVLCSQVISQPVTNEPSLRHARELIECCPCPRDNDQNVVGGSQLRDSSLDDCPCRPGGVDSEGASSILFPTTVRADEPVIKSSDSKQDTKNLLEPEVALATSMLDTLREATEEEFQDALARDAARSAIESDAIPEESAANVVFIVHPKDSTNDEDIISAPSHLQQTRCIYPFGNENLGKIKSSKPTNLLPAIQSNLLHMDNTVQASNVQPVTFDDKRNALKFAPLNSIFKSNPLKSLIDDSKSRGAELTKNNNESSNLASGNIPLVRPLLKFNKSAIPRYYPTSALTNVENHLRIPDDKSIKFPGKAKLPFHIRNLLKLKDVELIPKNIRNKSLGKTSFLASKFSKQPQIENSNDINLKNNCDEYDRSTNDFATDIMSTENGSESKYIQQFNKSDEDLDAQSDKNSAKDCSKAVVDSNPDQSDIWTGSSQVQPIFIETNNENKKYVSPSNGILEKKLANNDLELEDPPTNLLKEIQDKAFEIITDTNKPQTTKFIINETSTKYQNKESKNTFNSQSLNQDFDSKLDSSNIIATVVPLEEQEIQATHLWSQNQESPEGDLASVFTPVISNFQNEDEISLNNSGENAQSQLLVPIKTLPSVSETLSSLRENVEKSFKNLKNPSFQPDSFGISNRKVDIGNQNQTENLYLNCEKTNLLTSFPSQSPVIIDTDSINNIKSISMNDLQNMSDKLLNLNSKNQNNKPTSDSSESTIMSDENNFMSNGFNGVIDNKSSETTIDFAEKQIPNYSDISCTSNINDEITKKSGMEMYNLENQDTKRQEMDTGASDTIMKTLPRFFDPVPLSLNLRTSLVDDTEKPSKDHIFLHREPLGQVLNLKTGLPTFNKNREPLSLFDNLTSFKDPLGIIKPPLRNVIKLKSDWPNLDDLRDHSSFVGDHVKLTNNVLNLSDKRQGDFLSVNAQLPILDNFQNRLASIFNTHEKSEEEVYSLESDVAQDSYEECMTPEASKIYQQSKFPAFKNIEDLSRDAFINKPLASMNNLSKPSHLNSRLNAYRSKLSVPSDLQLESVNTVSKLLKTKTKTNKPTFDFASKPSAYVAKPSDLLSNAFEDLSSLDELRNTFQSKMKYTPNRPMKPNLNLLEKNVLSNDVQNIVETIRLNTQKTMKGIQQKMKSALKKPIVKSPISDTFAKPQELLDDMHDKLKGIHYDLNDRISSVHEDILDSTKLKEIFNLPGKTANRNFMSNLRQLKSKQYPARLQTAASTVVAQEVDPNKPYYEHKGFGFDKNYKNFIKMGRNKDYNRQTSAESITTPSKNVQQTSSNEQKSNFRQNLPLSHFLKERKLFPLTLGETTNIDNIKKPVLKSPVSHFGNKNQPNKVTISFRTTTAMPILSSGSIPQSKVTTTLLPQFEERGSTPIISKQKLFAPNHKTPTEFKLLRNFGPIPSPFDEEIEDSADNFEQEYKHKPIPKPSILKEINKNNAHYINNNRENPEHSEENNDSNQITKPDPTFSVQPTLRPKNSGNLFLSKVPGTTSGNKLSNQISKKSNFNPTPHIHIENDDTIDMLRSPSRNSETISSEPLKENESYRCRMVCTKDFS